MTSLPLSYYVQFRDGTGNLVTGTDGQSWFAVSGAGVNVESTLNIGSSGRNITLNPLTFTLGTDTIDPALLAAEASGVAFTQIELAGYSGTGSNAVLVTDAVFKDAAIGSLASGNTGAAVEVEYADTVQRFYPANTTGQQPAPTVAGYDVLTKKADTSTDTATGSPGYAPAAPLAGTPAATDTSAPLTFYVQFRDTHGNVIDNGARQSWFAISGLSVPSTQTLHITDIGTGAGTITFDPLSFTIGGTALPTLLSEQAVGTTLGAVEIAGYDGTGATAVLAEDFLDRNAFVATIATGPDGSQAVTLATRDLVQSVYPPLASGGGLAVPVPVTDGWNRTTHMADTTADTHASLVGTPSAAPADGLTYYVQIRDSRGALLTGSDGQSWFAASDVGYGSEQTFNAAGAAAGEGFDPLTLTLAPDSILVKLFASQASGAALQQIELAGYDSTGSLVTDDAFKRALATTDQTNADGTASLAFGYEAFTQTTFSTGPLGNASTSTQGYNLLTKSPDTGTDTAGGTPGNALDAPAASVPPTAPEPGTLTYYVQIRLQGGALLTGAGGTTWFAVSNVGFDTTQTLDGGNSGRVGFGALSFTLGAETVLPSLFTDEAAGNSFQTVELAGYSGSGAAAALVSDDLFKLAAIGSTTTNADGTATLSVQYGGLLETAYAPDANGTPAPVASLGWSVVRNTADNTTTPIGGGTTYPLAAGPTGTPAVPAHPGPLTYYVQFRSYGGSYLADGNGATWFAVTGLNLPTSQALTIGSQSSGAGGGQVSFGPVSFTFVDPTLQPRLFTDSATGTPFESVEIAGYAESNAAASLVQDDILKLAAVGSVQAGSDDSTTVSLEYGGLVERSYTTDPSGTLVPGEIGGWNRVTNASDTGTTALATEQSAGAAGGATSVAPKLGPPLAAGGAPGLLTYFVQFLPQNTTQPLLDSTGASFIPVSDLSFTTEQTFNIGSQSTGAGAGRINFDPLTFTIDPSTISTALLHDLASGASFQRVYIAGYSDGLNSPFKTVDDRLADATVSELTTNSDGSETVSLGYVGLQETANIRPHDTSSPPQSVPAGWDRVRNVDATTADMSSAPFYSLPDASPACYCPGTRIATPDGEVPVERLAEGDLVLTADGRALPVIWIGRRAYRGRFVRGRRDILPVTIAAEALADGIPARDLTISPEHAMLIDGLLVPAHLLVNGSTVTQAANVDEVHYFHLELPQHEAILAEGAPAESFVDDNSRGAFHNAGEWHGDCRRGPATYCAPRVESGYELEAIRRRIDRRAERAGDYRLAG